MPFPSLIHVTLLSLLFLVTFSETIRPTLTHGDNLKQPLFDLPQLEVRSLQSTTEEKTEKVNETEEKEPAAENKSVGNAEVVVSPEFTIHNLSHNHSEADDAAADVFDDYINLAFSELSSFTPQQPTPIPSITPPSQVQTAEPQQEQPQNDAIPNLSDLRNINIDQLPQTFP